MSLHIVVRCGFHHSFGFLRRPELDDDNGFCYEAPDGDLIFSGVAAHDQDMLLYEMLDPKTGEHYLVDDVSMDC